MEKTMETETYKLNLVCKNCDHEQTTEIPKQHQFIGYGEDMVSMLKSAKDFINPMKEKLEKVAKGEGKAENDISGKAENDISGLMDIFTGISDIAEKSVSDSVYVSKEDKRSVVCENCGCAHMRKQAKPTGDISDEEREFLKNMREANEDMNNKLEEIQDPEMKTLFIEGFAHNCAEAIQNDDIDKLKQAKEAWEKVKSSQELSFADEIDQEFEEYERMRFLCNGFSNENRIKSDFENPSDYEQDHSWGIL